MLIINCDINDRPDYLKKRYFMLMTMLGLGSIYRNKINAKLFMSDFRVEKHVVSINGDPQ